jgi:hypothetical protein
MADKIVTGDLEKALDESLEALAKSAGEAEEAKGEKCEKDEKKEPEEAKGAKPDFLKKKGEKDEESDEEKAKKEQEDGKGDEKKPEAEEAKADEKGEDEDEKSMRDGRKAAAHEILSKSETVANAIEVSKFLREVVKSLADMNGELLHRVSRLEKSQAQFQGALVKSQSAQADLIKSFGADAKIAAKAPLARKGVDARDAATIEKSFRGDDKAADGLSLTKSQIAERLCDLEISGKVPLHTTSKFEMNGSLDKSFEGLVRDFQKA